MSRTRKQVVVNTDGVLESKPILINNFFTELDGVSVLNESRKERGGVSIESSFIGKKIKECIHNVFSSEVESLSVSSVFLPGQNAPDGIPGVSNPINVHERYFVMIPVPSSSSPLWDPTSKEAADAAVAEMAGCGGSDTTENIRDVLTLSVHGEERTHIISTKSLTRLNISTPVAMSSTISLDDKKTTFSSSGRKGFRSGIPIRKSQDRRILVVVDVTLKGGEKAHLKKICKLLSKIGMNIDPEDPASLSTAMEKIQHMIPS